MSNNLSQINKQIKHFEFLFPLLLILCGWLAVICAALYTKMFIVTDSR